MRKPTALPTWRKPRPDLRAEARRPLLSIRSVDRRLGQEIVDEMFDPTVETILEKMKRLGEAP